MYARFLKRLLDFLLALASVVILSPLYLVLAGVGAIMMMYLHGGDWEGIRNALLKIGAPVDAKGLGVMDADIIEALMSAHKIRKDRFTILGTSGLTKQSAEKAAKMTKVI